MSAIDRIHHRTRPDRPPAAGRRPRPSRPAAALGVLARRRFALSVRTPRELLVPLLAPVMFAIVIAPALDSIGPTVPGVDYMSFTAVGIAGLLIPLNSMFAGIGAVVDREGGARRDLLAAPVSRPLLVLANLASPSATTALQVARAHRGVRAAGRRARRLGHGPRLVRRGRRGARGRPCTAWRRRSPTRSPASRTSPPPCRASPSSRSSSPGRCSRSARCPPP